MLYAKRQTARSASVPTQFKMMQLLVEGSQVEEALRKTPTYPTVLRQWGTTAVE